MTVLTVVLLIVVLLLLIFAGLVIQRYMWFKRYVWKYAEAEKAFLARQTEAGGIKEQVDEYNLGNRKVTVVSDATMGLDMHVVRAMTLENALSKAFGNINDVGNTVHINACPYGFNIGKEHGKHELCTSLCILSDAYKDCRAILNAYESELNNDVTQLRFVSMRTTPEHTVC